MEYVDYEKLHKDTIAKLQEMVNSGKITVETACSICADFVPECEDEGIRKAIHIYLDWLDGRKDYAPKGEYTIKDMIAWLEKQGEHVNFRNKIEIGDKVTRNEDGVLVNLSQLARVAKPADNVIKPKFRKGDWIVHRGTENVYQVVAVIDNQYQLKYGDNYTVQKCADVDRCSRLWTIQDAKDGDVLACNDEILLFKSYSVQGRISLYCWYNGQTNNFHGKEVNDSLLTTRNRVCPATKEQRDTLKREMADAGYTFNFEKTKKI